MVAARTSRIIAVTASAMDDNRQELMEIGADDFIGKPFRRRSCFKRSTFMWALSMNMPTTASRGSSKTHRFVPAQWPQGLIDAMRDAVCHGRFGPVVGKDQGGRSQRPYQCKSVRRLAEDFQYQKLSIYCRRRHLVNPKQPSGSGAPPASILAVDDTPPIFRSLAGMLKERGYKVRRSPAQAGAAGCPT